MGPLATLVYKRLASLISEKPSHADLQYDLIELSFTAVVLDGLPRLFDQIAEVASGLSKSEISQPPFPL